ncbi:MAG: nucleoside triphosphate pyrophosphohydrolase [Gemmatimonadota bacterium]|nr:nucleoside triphosphate pyrophosphohydrolase [Gemmatimonadota bacterium]
MSNKISLDDTLALMRDLRKRCDWDASQTHDSLRPYLVEESLELDDALRLGDDAQVREELGDLLLQVLFHSVVAEERGAFDFHDVAAGLIAKMKARHPHLYGDGERESWERMKSKKRASLADGLPVSLPPLHRAHRLQDRAAGVGFDWPDAQGPSDKVAEELAEVRELLAARKVRFSEHGAPVQDEAHAALEGELGDLLFACVNLCRKLGVHSSLALDIANAKFQRRFEEVERVASERGVALGEAGLETLDAIWDEVKRDRE